MEWQRAYINYMDKIQNPGVLSWYNSIEWIPLGVDIVEFMRCIKMQKICQNV